MESDISQHRLKEAVNKDSSVKPTRRQQAGNGSNPGPALLPVNSVVAHLTPVTVRSLPEMTHAIAVENEPLAACM